MQRRRFKRVLPFPDRLANESERLREEAEKLPHGPEREILLRKARQADIAFMWTNGFPRRDCSRPSSYLTLLRLVGLHGLLHLVGEPIEVLMQSVEHFALGHAGRQIAN